MSTIERFSKEMIFFSETLEDLKRKSPEESVYWERERELEKKNHSLQTIELELDQKQKQIRKSEAILHQREKSLERREQEFQRAKDMFEEMEEDSYRKLSTVPTLPNKYQNPKTPKPQNPKTPKPRRC